MVTRVSLASVLVALFILESMMNVSAHGRAALELNMDFDLLSLGTHDPCGQLICRAKGNSFTIKVISMTRVKVSGESTDVMKVSANQSQNEVSSDNDVRGNGTLVNNQGHITLDLLAPDVCESSYFICGVTYTAESGQTQTSFTTAGPGQPRSFQPYPDSVHPEQRPGNPFTPELQLLRDQLRNMEAKFESLSDTLDRRVALVFDVVRAKDTSSRVNRLEDRLSSFLMSEHAESSTTPQQAVGELNGSVTAMQDNQLQEKKPGTCLPGMGDDVTKSYPPYFIFTLDTLDREALCETRKNGGGWIVIQRRAKGDVNFYRDWTSYRDGFGSPTGDFWLGNEAVHQLTSSEAYELRVDIRFKDQEYFAEYAHFRIENEANKYRLQVSQYSGNAGDGLTYSNDQPFSTFEVDNSGYGCAIDFHGAWWYKSCTNANLNGKWGVPADKGIIWGWAKGKLPISFSEMKIRPI